MIQMQPQTRPMTPSTSPIVFVVCPQRMSAGLPRRFDMAIAARMIAGMPHSQQQQRDTQIPSAVQYNLVRCY